MLAAPPIEDITQQIIRAFNPRRIVLFGSRVRGDAQPESDLDVMVEMETDAKPADRVRAILALFGLRTWAMDVFVYTPEEVQRLRGVNGTLLSVIESQGKTVYERPN